MAHNGISAFLVGSFVVADSSIGHRLPAFALQTEQKGHSVKWLTVLVIVIAWRPFWLRCFTLPGSSKDDNANLTRFGAFFQKRRAMLIPRNSASGGPHGLTGS